MSKAARPNDSVESSLGDSVRLFDHTVAGQIESLSKVERTSGGWAEPSQMEESES